MIQNLAASSMTRAAAADGRNRFATLTFERDVVAPASVLWEAWTAPAARAIWAAPAPSLTVEFLEADTRVGGREVSLCKVEGQPDIRCDCGWLELLPPVCSVNYEVVSSGGLTQSAALVTADISGTGERSRLVVTVQLSSLAEDMEASYRQGFGAGLDNLAGAAEHTMVLQRVIRAPRSIVWGAWMNPETLARWWGPEGFFCRTKRIDLRRGGEWVFDMIAPDGKVFPNHHIYNEVRPEERIGYMLLRGENGPKHAGAWASFEDQDGRRRLRWAWYSARPPRFRRRRASAPWNWVYKPWANWNASSHPAEMPRLPISSKWACRNGRAQGNGSFQMIGKQGGVATITLMVSE